MTSVRYSEIFKMTMNTYGRKLSMSIFGTSHGEGGLGVTVDGFPANRSLDESMIQLQLDRRKPGQSEVTTGRKELDTVHIIDGVFEGKTTGTPIHMTISNEGMDSSKYEAFKDMFRPGHADLTYFIKYHNRDWRGGGYSSGRLTAPMVAASALARIILDDYGIRVTGYTKSVGDIEAENIDYNEIEQNPVRCPDKDKAEAMKERILKVKADGDTIGGLVEVVVDGVPAGLGEPRFGNLRGELSQAFYAMGAITSVGFGAGYDARYMLGSQYNDQMYMKSDGTIGFYSNNSGGIQGGITNGQSIVAQLVVRPTASITKEQNTVDIYGKDRKIKVEGKHDPCICPRVVPVAEGMAAFVIANHLLEGNGKPMVVGVSA